MSPSARRRTVAGRDLGVGADLARQRVPHEVGAGEAGRASARGEQAAGDGHQQQGGEGAAGWHRVNLRFES